MTATTIAHPGSTRTATFAATYLEAALRPRRTFDEVVRRADHVSIGARAIAIPMVLYTAVYFFLSRNGGRPTEFAPWLAIAPESYYRWNLWLSAPSILLAWIASSALAHLVARALGGAGTFERTLATFGLAASLATWCTGAHDVLTTFLGYVGVIDQRAYEDQMNDATSPAGILIWTLMSAYLVAFFVLFAKAAGAAHRLSPARASLAGGVGVVAYQLLFVLFNR